MLTTPQIDPIQSSFVAAMANRDDLITDFYRSLFAREPALRGMFSSDIPGVSEDLRFEGLTCEKVAIQIAA